GVDIVHEIIRRERVAMIQRVKMEADLQLPKIVQASDVLRLHLRARQRRQQQRRKDGDDRNDHEELDQREPATSTADSEPHSIANGALIRWCSISIQVHVLRDSKV